MNRAQAVNIIKEIFDHCNIEGKSIKLLPPKEDGALAQTFQIHIQTKDDPIIQGCIENIVKKQMLSTKLHNGWLIIYKHYSKEVTSK